MMNSQISSIIPTTLKKHIVSGFDRHEKLKNKVNARMGKYYLKRVNAIYIYRCIATPYRFAMQPR
jgi:hypothetical protein